MGSSFTLTLANIFMLKWEKQLVQRHTIANEIYGRYVHFIILNCVAYICIIHLFFLDTLMISSLLQMNHLTKPMKC
jgi:hypothetical protein